MLAPAIMNMRTGSFISVVVAVLNASPHDVTCRGRSEWLSCISRLALPVQTSRELQGPGIMGSLHKEAQLLD